MISKTRQETMKPVLARINALDRKGQLGSDTNPQLIEAVRVGRGTSNHFGIRRALIALERIEGHDSIPVAVPAARSLKTAPITTIVW